MLEMLDEYLTPDEVAERLKLHPYTVRKMLREGALPGKKLGPREWRVSAAALRAFMEAPTPETKKEGMPRKAPRARSEKKALKK